MAWRAHTELFGGQEPPQREGRRLDTRELLVSECSGCCMGVGTSQPPGVFQEGETTPTHNLHRSSPQTPRRAGQALPAHITDGTMEIQGKLTASGRVGTRGRDPLLPEVANPHGTHQDHSAF